MNMHTGTEFSKDYTNVERMHYNGTFFIFSHLNLFSSFSILVSFQNCTLQSHTDISVTYSDISVSSFFIPGLQRVETLIFLQ